MDCKYSKDKFHTFPRGWQGKIGATHQHASLQYAVQEQFRRHSAAHSSRFLLPTRRNPSGDFVPGMARKPSPHRGASSFRRQPFEKLPRLHSSALAGSKPSRHLHAGAAPPPAVPSQ